MPNTNAAVNVEQWTDLFRTVGLGDAQMHRWHEEFERRLPAGHQSFLEWLGLSGERIAEIRSAAGKA